jgi:hypothetical protein
MYHFDNAPLAPHPSLTLLDSDISLYLQLAAQRHIHLWVILMSTGCSTTKGRHQRPDSERVDYSKLTTSKVAPTFGYCNKVS